MIRLIRQHIAARRLAKLVEANRRSFEVEQYRRKRQAALKAGTACAIGEPGTAFSLATPAPSNFSEGGVGAAVATGASMTMARSWRRQSRNDASGSTTMRNGSTLAK